MNTKRTYRGGVVEIKYNLSPFGYLTIYRVREPLPLEFRYRLPLIPSHVSYCFHMWKEYRRIIDRSTESLIFTTYHFNPTLIITKKNKECRITYHLDTDDYSCRVTSLWYDGLGRSFVKEDVVLEGVNYYDIYQPLKEL